MRTKLFFHKYSIGLLFLVFGLSQCTKNNDTIDQSLNRLFRPVTFTTGAITATGINFTFSKVINAEKYIIELSEKDSLHFDSIARTIQISADTLTFKTGTTNMYTVPVGNLKGGIRYSARIKAATNNGTIPDSKYDYLVFTTKAQ